MDPLPFGSKVRHFDANLNQKGAGPFLFLLLMLSASPARAHDAGVLSVACRPLYRLAQALVATKDPRALRDAVHEMVQGHLPEDFAKWYADGFEDYLRGKLAGKTPAQILAGRDASIFLKTVEWQEGVYARRLAAMEKARPANLAHGVPPAFVDQQIRVTKDTLAKIRSIRARGRMNYLEFLDVTAEHPAIMEEPGGDRGAMLSKYFDSARSRTDHALEDFPFEMWIPMHEDPGVVALNRTGPLGLHVEGMVEFPTAVDLQEHSAAYFTEHDRLHARQRMQIFRARRTLPRTPLDFATWLMEQDSYLARYRQFESWTLSHPDVQERDILNLMWKEADRERLMEPHLGFDSVTSRIQVIEKHQASGFAIPSIADAVKSRLVPSGDLHNIRGAAHATAAEVEALKAKVDRCWGQFRSYLQSPH